MTRFDQAAGADTLARVSDRRAEPAWLIDLRLRALRRVGTLAARGSSPPDIPLPDIDALLADLATAGRVVEPDVRLDVDGVLFCDLSTAVRDHAELVEPYLGALVGADADALSALNTAVWMHGWFVHVAPGVRVDGSLQIDVAGAARRAGPFDRTLIVAGHDASVEVIDGCSAPVYTTDVLQAGVVEVVAGPRSRVGYAAIQNWSTHVDNQATRWAQVDTDARLDWIDGHLGARHTGRRPTIALVGRGATTTVRSLGLTAPGRHHATGADIIHAAPDTTSTIVERTILHGGGTVAGGTVDVADHTSGAAHDVDREVLALDGPTAATDGPGGSRFSTPDEATVTRLDHEQRLYLASRGLSDRQMTALVVSGFIEPITRHLPVEESVEWTRLIELQIGDALG